MKRIRAIAPMGLAIILLIATTYYLYSGLVNGHYDIHGEMVSRWDQRLEPLRDALPQNVHQVGYVYTSMIVGDNTTFDIEEFFLTQYSIAPVVMQLGLEQEWIIGNFDKNSGYQQWLEARIAKYDIQYFGFDLYLIHRLDMQ